MVNNHCIMPRNYNVCLQIFLLLTLFSCDSNRSVLTNFVAVNTIKPSEESSLTSNVIAVKKWVYSMQHTSGLMESAEDTNFVSLYDNALAALFFIQEDEKEKAEALMDFYNSKIDDEVLVNGAIYQTRTINGNEAQTLWMGDNAWLLIAINHYRKTYDSDRYDRLGKHIEKWLRSLQNMDGGLKGGIRANGLEMPKVTEGIITAFNAVPGYDDFHKNILKFLKNERWDSTAKVLMAWPENPKYAYAMDVHSLSSIIFPDLAENTLLEANRYMNQQVMTMKRTTITGYGFDEDSDVVWLEGTAQMAVAFRNINRNDLAKKLLANLDKSMLLSTKLLNAKGLPYATNDGTGYGSTQLWQHAHTRPALSSSLWYIFATTDFNPFALGNDKKIPEADTFWREPLLN